MFDRSFWAFVDPLTVTQAACLWADADPHQSLLSFRPEEERSRIAPFLQLLLGGFATGEFPADPTNPMEVIGHFETSNVTRENLRAFVLKRNLRPAFLFDTLQPNQTEPPMPEPSVQGKSRGGRPSEYDWDAMTGEVLRIADEDGLPSKQAELIDLLLLWFDRHYGKEPSESLVKARVSALYRCLRTAKEMKAKNPVD
jgi:hypothetical protein